MSKKIENITIGCDPEFFLKNKNTGEYIPAVGLIGGTKSKPTDISPEGKTGYAIQEDNVMVEFNIPPANSAQEMINSIDWVIDYIKENKLPSTLMVDSSPSAEFDPKYLKSKQAMMFGCEPDINAWKCCENVSPTPNGNFRCAGGHVHIGYSKPDIDDSLRIIKAMDLFLGVPSIIYDEDKERRKMYGKAGALRFKSFGVEYRTLSNFWIFKEELIEWVFNNTHKAIEFINTNKNFDKLISKEEENIVECINTQNKESAEKLIKKYNIPIPDFNKKPKNPYEGLYTTVTKKTIDQMMREVAFGRPIPQPRVAVHGNWAIVRDDIPRENPEPERQGLLDIMEIRQNNRRGQIRFNNPDPGAVGGRLNERLNEEQVERIQEDDGELDW